MAEAVAPPFDRPDAGFNDLPGWTWVGTYGGYYLQADLLGDFEHGFFTRQWQGRDPEALAAYVSAGISVHRTRQVHGATVISAGRAGGGSRPEADGLVSETGGQSLWVSGADCTPVLLADAATGAVAACHAGWRGVAGRIVPAAVAALESRGSRRADLLVALGPAVSGERYQVAREVSLQVAAALRSDEAEDPLAELRDCGALLEDAEADRDRLDIRAATRRQLLNEGIADERIAICPCCTVAEPLLFHSWRRDAVRAVQWSVIVAQA